MKGTSHRILSLIMALVLVVSMFAVIVAPASATAIVAAAVAPSPTTAGAAATYTITVTPFTPIVANDTITITFPAGTIVPTSIAKASVTVGGTVILVDAVVNGLAVTIQSPIGFGVATDVVISQIAGIKNPNLGKTTYKASVYTSKDSTPAVDSAAYTISRLVTFSPAKQALNGAVTVTGVGFAANSSVDIGLVALNNGALGSGTTDANGAFTVVATANAAAPISATDGAGNSTNSATALVLIPALVFSPTSAIVGSTVQVTVNGLTANKTYGLSWAGICVSVNSVITGVMRLGGGPTGENVVDTTLTGTKVVVNIIVPAGTSSGTKTVGVRLTDAAGGLGNFTPAWAMADLGTANFTVGARIITVTPTTASRGDTIIVVGSGFDPSSAGVTVTANLTITDSNSATTAALLTNPASVDASGNFNASVKIPTTCAPGAGKVTATSSLGSKADATLTISGASMTLNPTSGSPGTVVQVTGKGFVAYTTYNGVTTPSDGMNYNFPQQVVVGGDGTFTTSFIWAGKAAAGVYQVELQTTTAPIVTFTQTDTTISVTTGLNSIAGNYTIVWGYNAALQQYTVYDPAAPAGVNDLSILTKGLGYWIQATQACTIIYGGNSYVLVKGWNSIGWLGS